MPLPVIDLYNTIFPKNKKVPQSSKYKLCGVLPGSGAGLFLVHELLEGNPVLDCDLVAFLNINPVNQSGNDRVPVMRARPDASYNAQWSPDWVYNYVQTPCHSYGS